MQGQGHIAPEVGSWVLGGQLVCEDRSFLGVGSGRGQRFIPLIMPYVPLWPS